MADSKNSKLSAMAADYYPSQRAQKEMANPVLAYSNAYSYGSYHPGSQQLSPDVLAQSVPFLLQSTPVPFQSPFMYVRPPFVNGFPMQSIQQSYNNSSAAKLSYSGNAYNREIQQRHRRHAASASSPRHQMPPEQTREMNCVDKESSTQAAVRNRKKKKKSKRNGQPGTDLDDAVGKLSLNVLETNSDVVSASANSYSAAVKNQLAAQPPEEDIDNASHNFKRTVIEDSLESNEKVLSSDNLDTRLAAKRGILRVPAGTTDITASSQNQRLDSLKLDLARLSQNSNLQKKQKNIHPESTVIVSNTHAEQGLRKCTSPSKKLNSSTGDVTLMSADSSVSDRKPKFSRLKKVILEERKKRQQHTVDTEDAEPHANVNSNEQSNLDHDSEVVVSKDLTIEHGYAESCTPAAKTLSINCLGNICNSYLSSALSGLPQEDADAVCRRLHRRRFREYCNQVLGAALDDSVYLLLTTLGVFQQRQYELNSNKAKLKRRYVCGLREAVKHIQLGKAKCIVLAPNIERIPGKGGLDDLIGSIILQCAAKGIPVIFALGRVALGRACSKPSPVSSVAIVSQAGAEEKFKQTLELAQRAHESYIELVKMAVTEQVEQREHNAKQLEQAEKKLASQPGSHVQFSSSCQLGHSRNASNISAISFISAMSDSSLGGGGMGGAHLASNDTAEEDSGSSHSVSWPAKGDGDNDVKEKELDSLEDDEDDGDAIGSDDLDSFVVNKNDIEKLEDDDDDDDDDEDEDENEIEVEEDT